MFIRLKQLREKFNYTQEDIAKVLEISRPSYSLYESGKREIPLKFLSKLAFLYDTSIDYIVGDTDNYKPFKKNSKP